MYDRHSTFFFFLLRKVVFIALDGLTATSSVLSEQWVGATAWNTTETFHNKYKAKYIHISSPIFVNLIYFGLLPPVLPKANWVNAHTAASPAASQCLSDFWVHTTVWSRWISGWWGGPSTRAAQTVSPWSGQLSRFCDWLCWWRTWWAHCSPLRHHLWT